MKVKKSVVFAAALACGILLAVPLGAGGCIQLSDGRKRPGNPRGKRTAEPYVSVSEY